jgi:hypothetical protein
VAISYWNLKCREKTGGRFNGGKIEIADCQEEEFPRNHGVA